jgi:hypothetical protein
MDTDKSQIRARKDWRVQVSGMETYFCRRCGAVLVPGQEATFYVVNVEAYADPTGPRVSKEEMAAGGGDEIEELLKELEGYSEQELLDMVHRKMTFHLCGGCYARWIEHPTG